MTLHHGDCLDVLRMIEPDSLDSLVTDPPAGISFMGKEWDGDKGGRDAWVAWLTEVMRECHRVLKPGAHGLVWALPRTSHWTATALENAGFEIRDVVTHLFGTGFPKSLDISKAIEKVRHDKCPNRYAKAQKTHTATEQYDELGYSEGPSNLAATEAAKKWSGYGTALKPACEMWVLVRKPLGEKTVAANVLKWGTGGLNVDRCRIAGSVPAVSKPNGGVSSFGSINDDGWKPTQSEFPGHAAGRFPANLVLSHNDDCELVGAKKVKATAPPGRPSRGKPEADGASWSKGATTPNLIAHNDGDGTETVEAWQCSEGCAVRMLDEQSGERKGSRPHVYKNKQPRDGRCFGDMAAKDLVVGYSDSGGASRFFYCAKASKADRGEGNTHPTVKSTTLMGYLIKLVTPVGGIVLDPFMGSGSTGVAAKRAGFEFLGVERDEAYAAVARERIA